MASARERLGAELRGLREANGKPTYALIVKRAKNETAPGLVDS